ncbi:hypothetical protein [Escherichia coli]|uniref:hypothetical protein n=1 Tax=Escherichia coli TaxID=562 RepID=UPI0030CD4B44
MYEDKIECVALVNEISSSHAIPNIGSNPLRTGDLVFEFPAGVLGGNKRGKNRKKEKKRRWIKIREKKKKKNKKRG